MHTASVQHHKNDYDTNVGHVNFQQTIFYPQPQVTLKANSLTNSSGNAS